MFLDDQFLLQMQPLGIRKTIHEPDKMETGIVDARASLHSMQAVTWERVRDETSRDGWLLQLINMAEHGFPSSSQLMPPQLLPYWCFKDN